MKAILVPLASDASYTSILEADDTPSSAGESHTSVLHTSLLLARSLDAYIEGFPLGPELPDVYGMEVPMVLPAVLDESWRREVVARSREAFVEFMRANDVPERFDEPRGLCFGWHGPTLRGDTFLGDYGRAFDVIVVPRPTPEHAPRQASLEAALFNSGRAVVVAPPAPPPRLGTRIVIAWNGSTETARAISFAMPLLLKAEKVTVLTVEGGTVPGPSGQQISRTLRINGVPADAMNAEPNEFSVGEAILFYANQLGADLLIKGGYTHSRLREMIFGGPTRYLLEHATLPILMAH